MGDLYSPLQQNLNMNLIESIALDKMAAMDLTEMVLGDCIGRGEYRTVFEFPLNLNWVIKYEHNLMSCNALEYDIWSTMKRRKKKYHKWFAPCISMSMCTKFLIMEKTKSVLTWPDEIPKMLGDTHIGNFGMLDGKFVCHDYGSIKIMRDNFDMLEMKKAKWRTGDES